MFVVWRKWIHQLCQQYFLEKRPYHRNMLLLLSRHPYLPLSLVQLYPHIWDKVSLQAHPRMTRQFYKKYVHRGEEYHPVHRRKHAYFQGQRNYDFVQWEKQPFRKTFLSYHPMLPLQLVLKFPNMGWDYTFLLLYRRWSIYQMEVLIRCRRMDWVLMSRNPFIDCIVVRHFIRFPWDWMTLAVHPSFPPHVIYKDNILIGKWKWKQVFKNPTLSLDFWKELSNMSTNKSSDPYIILHNKFQYDTFLQAWATFKIVDAISHYRKKKHLQEKLKLLMFIKTRTCRDTMYSILSFT